MRTLAACAFVACAFVCLLAPSAALAQQGFTAPGAAQSAAHQPASPSAALPAWVVPPPRSSRGDESLVAPSLSIGLTPGSKPATPAPDAVTPPEKKEREFALDLGVATEFPISLGGYVGMELPGRLLFQVGAGVMPGGYVNAIDSVLTGVGAYDANVSKFVTNALSDSFVLRLSGGWRPFSGHGFEILGGYTLVTLGGSAQAGEVINAVLAESGSAQRVSSAMGPSIPLSATLHNVHVSLGWRWLVADDRVVIRASVSYLQCLSASAGVKLPEGQGQGTAMEAQLNQELNNFVEPYFTRYVKAPLVGLSAGYRF